MGFLDRLFGTGDERRDAPRVPQPDASTTGYRAPDGGYAPPPAGAQPRTDDEAAIERYRYLLRTAPPETIEQVHAEAFGRLTESQRQQVLADLSAQLPEAERPRGDDPQALARAATRAEYSHPGFMERTFGNRGFGGTGGPGFGSMLGASILGTVAGYVVGSALVGAFLAPAFADDPAGTETEAASDPGADAGADGGYGDSAGAADAGGFGDLGGGDFGGDFGF